MTAVVSLPAGARLTAALLQAVAPLAAYKGNDESVLNSTTLQNDDALFLPVNANSTYMFVALFAYTAAASGDMKAGFTIPSGASITWSAVHVGSGGTLGIDRATSSGQTLVFWNTATAGIILGTAVIGSTAGTLQVEWAQNTANNTTATIMKAGSVLAAWQVA